jgi:hypothetical protein
LLDKGTSDPGEVDADASTFTCHTMLIFFGGVGVDFRASSFCFQTFVFFLGGVGITFGISSFCFGLFFFCSGLFLFSLFF